MRRSNAGGPSVPSSVDRHVAKAELPLARQQDPRHQIRVVLHLRQEDLVALDERARRAQVWTTRLMASVVPLVKMISLAMPSPEKRPTRIPGGLVELGRFLAQRVDRAVDVGVRPLVEQAHRVETCRGFGRSPPSRGTTRRSARRPCGEYREVARGPAPAGSPAFSRSPRPAGPARVRPGGRRRSRAAPGAERAAQHGQRQRDARQTRDARIGAPERGQRRVRARPRRVGRRAAFHHLRQEVGGGRGDRAGVALEADRLDLAVGAEAEAPTRRRSPQSGFTSSWTASAPGRSLKRRGCRKRSRITPP